MKLSLLNASIKSERQVKRQPRVNKRFLYEGGDFSATNYGWKAGAVTADQLIATSLDILRLVQESKSQTTNTRSELSS